MRISISVSDILTWVPILLSIVALYYSRKAFRYQVTQKRREHVALVNLRYLRHDAPRNRWEPAPSPGVVVTNPAAAPLNFADIRYYDKRFGKFRGEAVLRGIRQHTQTYPEIGRSIEQRREAGRRVVEILMDRQTRRQGYSLMARTLDRLLWTLADTQDRLQDSLSRFNLGSIRRSVRFKGMRGKRGHTAVAEMFLADEAGEDWYINIEQEKRRVPHSWALRKLFMAAYRMRLFGYPFWSDWSVVEYAGYSLWAFNLALVLDHFMNGGLILASGLAAVPQ
jgi:hypothetical protein